MNHQTFKCILIFFMVLDVVWAISQAGKPRPPQTGPAVAIGTVIYGLLILGVLQYC